MVCISTFADIRHMRPILQPKPPGQGTYWSQERNIIQVVARDIPELGDLLFYIDNLREKEVSMQVSNIFDSTKTTHISLSAVRCNGPHTYIARLSLHLPSTVAESQTKIKCKVAAWVKNIYGGLSVLTCLKNI